MTVSPEIIEIMEVCTYSFLMSYRIQPKFIKLKCTSDLNTKVAADSQGTFHFKILFFLHLLVLSAVYHMLLKIKI